MTLMTFSLEEEQVRELFKGILIELLEEKPEILYDVFLEAIEDAGLAAAIAESESDELVDRAEIIAILEGRS